MLTPVDSPSRTRATAHGLVISDPRILDGTPVFRGTSLPVATLFDYVADGLSLDFFIGNYPAVPRETAQRVLNFGWNRIEQDIGEAALCCA